MYRITAIHIYVLNRWGRIVHFNKKTRTIASLVETNLDLSQAPLDERSNSGVFRGLTCGFTLLVLCSLCLELRLPVWVEQKQVLSVSIMMCQLT